MAGQQLGVNAVALGGDGQLLSLGDLDVNLVQEFINSGEVVADGNARIETAATLDNQSILAAGNTLELKAATLDNREGGTITAANVTLQATDSRTLTNRGLINGGETVLESQTLNNLGSGKIYGDHLAIGAAALTNAAENGAAPVIAARARLDIGANTLDNREHALIFSGGDLAIGGNLDPAHRATGQAATLDNASATIEALGNADINAATLDNRNPHFSTRVETLPAQTIVEYQANGSPNRYLDGTPGVYTYWANRHTLHTPEGDSEYWSSYNYTRSTTETRVDQTDPGQILAGGDLTLTAATLNNDKSRIIAGGNLTATLGALNNTEVAGQRVITDAGSVTAYWRNHRKLKHDNTHSSTADYTPAATIHAITLTPTVYQQHTAPGGGGTPIAALSTATVNPSLAPQGGQAITPITRVALPAGVVRSGGINTRVPNSSLFAATPNPAAHYLIETNPAFANYRAWLSSDYLLDALALDPAITQKRLGDGFYEQRLLREQVARLTGRRFLDGYASDEVQYAALMDNGATFARAWHLVPGIELTAAQMAQLTSDIVWLVEKPLTLPDGSTSRALVPQLYARVREGDLQSGGALIAGNRVNLNVTGDLRNGGTLAGRQAIALTAANLHNLGGRILGDTVAVAANTDLDNRGGAIAADTRLTASAGRDLNITSTTRTQSNIQGSRTNIERIAGLYVTGSGGSLDLAAGRDLTLDAATLDSAGGATLVATRNLTLGTVQESRNNRIVWDGANYRSDASRAGVGTQIQTQGDLTLQAGNDLTAKAANVTSSQGGLAATAGNDLTLAAGQASTKLDEAHRHKSKSTFSSKTLTTRDILDQTSAQATTLSGNRVTVLADHDLTLAGSNVVSDSGTTLAARNDLTLEAATSTSAETHTVAQKKTGLGRSGFGLSVGTQKQNTDQQGATTLSAAATVGSTVGDLTLQAGNHYRQTGADVLAPQGDIAIGAQQIDIGAARETGQQRNETRFQQSGLTVALSSPVISAL